MSKSLSKNFKRLSFALAASLTSMAVTFAWNHAQLKQSELRAFKNPQEPLAKLVNLTHEVQRKPVDRIIWQSVQADEDLYAGETLRTNEGTHASIVFLRSQTVVDLEPNSLIVLEEVSGKVALNFIEGNLFVRAKSTTIPDEALTLKSGAHQISLHQTELSLGKQQNRNLNVDILSGSADIESSGKVISVKEGNSGVIMNDRLQTIHHSIHILSPKKGSDLYVDPKQRELLSIQFQPLGSDYTVFFEKGESRSRLNEVRGAVSHGESGRISLPLAPGIVYWRLIATSNQGRPRLTSQIQKTKILPLSPVSLLSPSQGQTISLESNESGVQFRWTNPGLLERLHLVVSTDPQLKKPLWAKEVSGDQENLLLQPGTYYWGVSGNLKKLDRTLQSGPQWFIVASSKKIPTPIPLSPQPKQLITQLESQDHGIEFSWSPIPSATSYSLVLVWKQMGNNNKRQVINVHKPKHVHHKLQPGRYLWSVTAFHDQEPSQPSETLDFLIAPTQTISWIDPTTTFNYLTERPTVELKWTPIASATKYRLKWASQDDHLDKTTWINLNSTPSTTQHLSSDGTFTFVLEALNSQDQVVARSPARIMDIAPLPLLPAPEFTQKDELPIKASNSGLARIEWQPVQGALNYQLTLMSKNSPPKLSKTNETTQLFSNLYPGEYTLTVQSMDRFGRVGPESERVTIVVPNASHLRAPALKKLEIK